MNAIRRIEDYVDIVGSHIVETILDLANRLRGVRVLHINSTRYGGGVAEILRSLVPLMQSVGLDVEWRVIQGDERFFRITKSIHNALQGARNINLSEHDLKYYVEVVKTNAGIVTDNFDIVIVHDPQPLPLIEFKRQGIWIWRCHIDTSSPDPYTWNFIKRFVEKYDVAIFTLKKFVPPDLKIRKVFIIPPAIDPLLDKNRELDEDTITGTLIRFDIDPERPLIGQVSRFDPWKNPLGVIDTYRLLKRYIPSVQLALIGSFAHDDPEGVEWYEKTLRYAENDKDIHILTDRDGVRDLEVNAFQRAFSVALQLSIREGFGLTVSEALWKGTPVVASKVGGIPLQVIDGVTGYLVENVHEAAKRALKLLRRPWLARILGVHGIEHVRKNFLITRLLMDYLKVFQVSLDLTKSNHYV